jgi:hypothetical protein
MPGCRFGDTYRFATGREPSSELDKVHHDGTVAEVWVRARERGEPSRFPLCRRHADLLWMLGYLWFEHVPSMGISGGHRPALAEDSEVD